jgi:hypothetical protein
MTAESEGETKQDRRDRYQSLLSAVEKNCGGPQPVGMSRAALVTNRKHAGLSLGTINKTLRAALENNDLIRFSLPGSAVRRYAPADTGHIRDALEALADTDAPDKEQIGTLNATLANVDD